MTWEWAAVAIVALVCATVAFVSALEIAAKKGG
jgi:hypothetical protein